VLELADRPALHAGDHPGRPGPNPGRGIYLYIIIGIVAKTTTKRPRKRGPKEERLVIREDPERALARLLKPTKPPKGGK
jgi:hypothetical protein